MYKATFAKGHYIFDTPAELTVDTDDEGAAFLAVLDTICDKFVKGDWDQYAACHRAKIIRAVQKNNWRRAIVAWERASGYEVTFHKLVGAKPPEPTDVKAKILTQCVVSDEELEEER